MTPDETDQRNRRQLMKTLYAALLCLLLPTPAMAVTLVADGITYELDLTSVSADGLTGNFTLNISGVNTASDTEGGRTGINGFAFGDPSGATALSGSSTGFTFQPGGLNSGGCNGSGEFFCFANTGAVFSSPLPSSGSLLFSVTTDLLVDWANWNPDFKIDWLGSKNNYDLVSKTLGVTNCTGGGCPTGTPFIGGAVPETSTWLMMIAGFGVVGAAMRRKPTVVSRVRFG
jgi:hypothetical protein